MHVFALVRMRKHISFPIVKFQPKHFYLIDPPLAVGSSANEHTASNDRERQRGQHMIQTLCYEVNY